MALGNWPSILSESDVIRIFKNHRQALSSYSYAVLLLWQDFFRFEFKMMADCLCVFAHHELGVFQYLPPLGKNISTDCLVQCFQYMEALNGAGGITRIENVLPDHLSLFDSDIFDCYKKADEIVYDKNNIVELKGNAYKSQRGAYNHCINHNDVHIQAFDVTLMSDCLELYQRWAQSRAAKNTDDIYCQMLADNFIVHKRLMAHYKEYGLVGRVVYIAQKICAYTFGVELTDDVFCVYCEIADLNIQGLPTYIFREFMKDVCWRDKTKVNVMDSFAAEGVKQTKKAYHPCAQLSSYVVSKRKHMRNDEK